MDGHNRYEICRQHSLSFSTTIIKFVTIGEETLPLDSLERAQIWVSQNQSARRNLDANDYAALAARLVPHFAAEVARRRGQNTFPLIKIEGLATSKSKNAGRAHFQAAAAMGANPRYVAAVIKAAGYDNKTRTFKKPEVLSAVGSGKDQKKVTDILKEQRQKNQAIKLAAITKENADRLPEEKTYSVIYADCPWVYDFEETDNRKVENHYPTMDIDTIKKFRVEFVNGKKKTVEEVGAKDSVLFFWATAPKLREALAVIEAWGFEYKTHAIWDKGKIGMGYWFRGQHELLLVATKGKMSPPNDYARIASIFRVLRKNKHSAKPELVYDVIEKMYPNSAKVELFACNRRPGWDSTGNQI